MCSPTLVAAKTDEESPEAEPEVKYDRSIFFIRLVIAARPISAREADLHLEENLVITVKEAREKGVLRESSDFLNYFLEHIRTYIALVHESEINLWRLHNQFLMDINKLIDLLPTPEQTVTTAKAA